MTFGTKYSVVAYLNMKVRVLPDKDRAIKAYLERHSSTRTFIADLGRNSVSDVDKNHSK